MAPILAAQEHDPMAAVRTTVGSSSAVNMYTMANAPDAAALPRNDRNIVTPCRSAVRHYTGYSIGCLIGNSG